MRKEIENWWKQAEADLKTAENSFNNKDYYASAFWCQQSVEKGLKAVILSKSKEKIIGHSLIHLGKTAEIPESYISKLKRLSPQYFLSRYPDASEDIPYELYDENVSNLFLKIAKEVSLWIKNQLK